MFVYLKALEFLEREEERERASRTREWVAQIDDDSSLNSLLTVGVMGKPLSTNNNTQSGTGKSE